ncbi:hypothetical protein DR79_1353 [Francisella tularensis]|nr:hypothetical protein DR85_1806 [Francisella tularensis]KFJ43090.1 hypothetical protein DR79_1353 [Francisella tularensis]KFJ67045.1 hypothetical protein DR84_1405 [Francisella tularensis]
MKKIILLCSTVIASQAGIIHQIPSYSMAIYHPINK